MKPELKFLITGEDQSKRPISSFRRGLDGARNHVRQFGADVQAASIAIGGLGKAALLGMTAASPAILAARQAASSIADIGDAAKRAGMDSKSFQELAYVADQNRISVDALTDGMKELSLRADEFIITGAGPAAEAFQRLGYSARDLKDGLADPSDLLIDIVGRLQQLDKAAQIRISDELFGGTAGERFVELVQRGADAMRDTVKEANDLNIIIGDELIKSADEVDKAFKRIEQQISVGLKTAIVTTIGVMKTYTIDVAEDLGKALGNYVITGEFGDITDDQKLANLGYQRVEIEAKIFDLKNQQRELSGATAQAEKQILDGQIAGLQARMKLISELEQAILNPKTTTTTLPPPPPGLPPDKDAIRDAERKEKAYQRVIDQLNRETAALGMNSVQQRIANQLALAGVDATSTRGQEIARLVTHLEEARAAQEAYNERLQFFGDLGADAFRGLVQGGEDFADVMRRVGMSIADAAVQAAIFGTGPLANLLGLGGSSNLLGLFGFGGGGIGGLSSSTFAGWYAEGGTIPSGKWGIAGEAGPEVVTGPARVWTADDMAAVAGRSGGGGTYAPTYNIDARGSEAGVEEKIIAALKQYDKEVAPGTAIRAVGNANRLSLGSAFRKG